MIRVCSEPFLEIYSEAVDVFCGVCGPKTETYIDDGRGSFFSRVGF